MEISFNESCYPCMFGPRASWSRSANVEAGWKPGELVDFLLCCPLMGASSAADGVGDLHHPAHRGAHGSILSADALLFYPRGRIGWFLLLCLVRPIRGCLPAWYG